jgi:hypothetical protein
MRANDSSCVGTEVEQRWIPGRKQQINRGR